MASRFLSRPGVRLSLGMTKLWFAWHLFATHGFQVGPADGPSMLPTFSTYGDWIGTDKRYRLGRGVRVGDLVLYQMPFARYDMGVKRVVGLPGDYVSVGTPGQQGEESMIQIPDGHCWVVGDNLVASRDSRTFGPLPLALIQGKVVAKVLPWNERQWFENPLQRVEQ
ncbi:hypothetical protein LMH87_010856 [Akanthomyces muscarius]|uniref:Peptidase S26 domain-containing protein n=1 Tax=Akanthomyces muscarius TaxID=2231603 RepID=A0A9W8QAD6_AKAMU|nr:hypothetical protein LMH87_010856 [Akanthomyces muscarius]KAJ4150090.1 hypothetical protein LMH87_010856 [Akanthomyces muscarius]